MKLIVLIFCITLFSTILYPQEEIKRKDGRTIIIYNDGTWKYKGNSDVKLVINPQNEGGGFGQISFSKDEKILIYFEQKSQKGKIIINGTNYILTSCSNDENSYKLYGNEVTITAKDLKDQGSGDCFHYKCPKVKITLNGVSTSIENVEILDCLSFSWE